MKTIIEVNSENELKKLIRKKPYFNFKPKIRLPNIESRPFYSVIILIVVFMIIFSFALYNIAYTNGKQYGAVIGYNAGKIVANAQCQSYDIARNLPLKDFVAEKIKQNWDLYLKWVAIILGLTLIINGFKIVGR